MGEYVNASVGAYLVIEGQEAAAAVERGDIFVYNEDEVEEVPYTITHGRVRWILTDAASYGYYAKVDSEWVTYFFVITGFD